jgi:hypothetical protein
LKRPTAAIGIHVPTNNWDLRIVIVDEPMLMRTLDEFPEIYPTDELEGFVSSFAPYLSSPHSTTDGL